MESKLVSTCKDCELNNNLWLCLVCGNLACGRKNWDGSGGNNHAIEHFQSTGHALCVKTGTITPEGDAAVYCYACDIDVKNENLSSQLAHFGMDIKKQVKTEKTMTELSLQYSLNLDLSKEIESGVELLPVYGDGFCGINNTGNTCYIASVFQTLFSLNPFVENYMSPDNFIHLMSCTKNPFECYECLTSKLATGLLTSNYSVKKSKPNKHDKEGGLLDYTEGINVAYIKSFLAEGHADFSSNKQQDAYEYFQFLLDKLDSHEAKLGRPKLSRFFEFETETKLICNGCSTAKVAVKKECSLILSIDFKQEYKEETSEVKISELLDRLADGEEIQGLNCEKCGSAQTFSKFFRILNFPRYLVVLFQRFVYDWTPIKLKVNLQIDNLTNLDFSCLTVDKSNAVEVISSTTYLKEATESEPEINKESLNLLMQQGIPEQHAKWALLSTNNNGPDAALEWYFMNMENPGGFLIRPKQSLAKTSICVKLSRR